MSASVLSAVWLLVAEVTAVSAGGFVSQHTLQFPGHSPHDVYVALTRDVASWWDASHSYSGEAKNFSLDARAGGCFCERLGNGGSVEHMRVVFADPGKELRLSGGLGPLQEMAVSGSMSFKLHPSEEGTTLQYTYAVGGYLPAGLETLAGPVDQVQLGQLTRLRDFVLGDPGD